MFSTKEVGGCQPKVTFVYRGLNFVLFDFFIFSKQKIVLFFVVYVFRFINPLLDLKSFFRIQFSVSSFKLYV